MFLISLLVVCLAISVKTDSCSLRPDGDPCTPKCSGSQCEQDMGKCCREICLPQIDFAATCDAAMNKFLNTTIGNAIKMRKRSVDNDGKISPELCHSGFAVDFLKKDENNWEFECVNRGYQVEDNGYPWFGEFCRTYTGDYTWEAETTKEILVGVQLNDYSDHSELCFLHTNQLKGYKKTNCWGFTMIQGQDSTGFSYRIPTGDTGDRVITAIWGNFNGNGYREWSAKTCRLVECQNDC